MSIIVTVDIDLEHLTINLTKEEVENVVQNRLQSAQLYDEEGEWGLDIYVGVTGLAYYTGIEYYKFVYDHSNSRDGRFTDTWSGFSYGYHELYLDDLKGSLTSYRQQILISLVYLMDEFIDEYLRVNADAC